MSNDKRPLIRPQLNQHLLLIYFSLLELVACKFFRNFCSPPLVDLDHFPYHTVFLYNPFKRWSLAPILPFQLEINVRGIQWISDNLDLLN